MRRVGLGLNADISLHEAAEYASIADGYSLDSFWMHEHSFLRDAVPFLTVASLQTSRIKLGFGCINPYTRNPVLLAQSLFTLHESSRGRMILGLGTGFPPRLDLMGIKHEKPIAAIKETIEVISKLWRGETVNFQGKIFSYRNVKPLTPSIDGKIPIYIAGYRPMMVRLAGKIGDGYLGRGGESVESLKEIIEIVNETTVNDGRKKVNVDTAAYLLCALDDDSQKAKDLARKDPFIIYMMTVSDDRVLEISGFSKEVKKPIAEHFGKGNLAEASKYVTDDLLDTFTLSGSPKEVMDKIEDFVAVGLKLPILQPISCQRNQVKNVLETARQFALSG
jgi:5,10-methylenetetrahydromethanopterin reductase